MSVPKAAVDEDDCLMLGQLKVGAPGKVAAIDTVPVTAREKPLADEELGLRIRTSDPRHHAAALGGGEGVHALFQDEYNAIMKTILLDQLILFLQDRIQISG
jgi:hypothetical protein